MTVESRRAEGVEARPTPHRIEELETEFCRAAVESHRRLYPAVRAEALEIGGGVAAFMGTLPFTRVFGFGMRGPVDENTFARLEGFYAERDAKTTIDLCPYADPSVLERLSRHGYRAAGWKQLLLRSVGTEERRLANPKSPIAVMRAEPGDVETWTRVVAQGFLEREEVDDKSRELYTTLFHTDNNTCWLALVDGVPAGGACLKVHGEFASLATTTVLPEFRRRGVQTALIRARLAFASESECTWARVAAYPGSVSHRNLERHGFQPIYTRMKFVLG